ncbi:hypothetical protein MY5147_009794 [Beauveria neobassiana]
MSSSAFVKSPLRRRRCRRTKQTGSYSLARDAAAHVRRLWSSERATFVMPPVTMSCANHVQFVLLTPNPL